MKKALVLFALVTLVAATNAAAQSQIAGGPHDFSAGSALTNGDTTTVKGQTCVFCHTPHGGGTAVPLWNRSAPLTESYQTYTSTTMDAAAPTTAALKSSASGACLSCHDGSVGIDVLSNIGGEAKTAGWVSFTAQSGAKGTYGNTGSGVSNALNGGLPYLGADLRNDHPVNIIYQTAYDATSLEFTLHKVVGTTTSKVVVANEHGTLPLYGSSLSGATVECASCHNPHNNTNGSFLRMSNASSNLCLTCHIK